MQQQIHAEGSVRHAEKRRRGTCRFANRVARTSLDTFDRSVPPSHRREDGGDASERHRTCVAAVVAHFPRRGGGGSSSNDGGCDDDADDDDDDDDDDPMRLQVMGLGAGTKFLRDAILRGERLEEGGYGKRIRDCHAEVLARRAFRRQIAWEMLSDLDRDGGGAGGGAAAVHGVCGVGGRYSPILERVKERDGRGRDDGDRDAAGRIRYRLRPGVTLHFYASSAPCGNAVLKKFTKMSKETFDASLGRDEWPKRIHVPIAAHSLHLGQFALLVKKDGSIPRCEPIIDGSIVKPTETQRPSEDSTCRERKRHKKPWPCRADDGWCPPSCSIPGFGRGTIHSCSDKLCRWNCLGMQGSLLAPALDGPLHMTTLTVGRKFSRAVCTRAVCCRADGFGPTPSSDGGVDDGDGGGNESRGKYELNHPTLMETNVYMDESGTHAMAGVKDVGRDVSFNSDLCWVWWPGKAPNDCGYAADCLDGKTGLKIDYRDVRAGLDEKEGASPLTYSECCTFSLFHLSMEILERSGVPGVPTREEIGTKLTLSTMRRTKCQISSKYESEKINLFCHRVFGEWSRRES